MTHLCFGYAYVVANKPWGYSFLPELDKCSANAIPIETAQPNLDPVILEKLPSNKVMLCVIDLGGQTIETAELVAERLHGALRYIGPDRLIAASDCGICICRATSHLAN